MLSKVLRPIVGPALLATMLATTLSLGGCGLADTIFGFAKSESSGGTRPKALKLRRVSLSMEESANDNWPATVEIIRVRDTNLIKEMLSIEASDWFKDKGEMFKSSNPDATFDRWEIVPGTRVDATRPGRVRGRVGGVLFCDLRDAQPSERISISGHILIKIGAEGCEVERFKRKRS